MKTNFYSEDLKSYKSTLKKKKKPERKIGERFKQRIYWMKR